ncbi:hypothetical protein [Pararhodobacter aggregans]|uniref:Uncharacterized protein n=1 Tax=Pararhodobacter aggregans TaxID=404875 RepID=A0A2T7UUG2_9RHOB|nr:hypothetical protein [Pararhodobacter aggregans]PTX04252.1 hypothetical protein C8N33_102533 [Pararhodobacter aggregans]PVE48304.1 hypothetical protein DDE23_04305 [Pararhodobacter aggregans]
MVRFLLSAAVLASVPLSASAQGLPIVGVWRCVMNSQPASIDMTVQLAPDQSLYAEGTYILNGTSAFYQIRGPGRWAVGPDNSMPGQTFVHMQVIPGNVATFSIHPAWIGDPNNMYALFQPPGGGGPVETACQRIG